MYESIAGDPIALVSESHLQGSDLEVLVLEYQLYLRIGSKPLGLSFPMNKVGKK